MKIAVKYMAQIRQAASVADEQIELPHSCSLQEFLHRLVERHGEPLRRLLLDPQGRLQPTILLFVADEQVGLEEDMKLKEGDVVTLLSPIAGG